MNDDGKIKITKCPPGFAHGYVSEGNINDIDEEFKNELTSYRETYYKTVIASFNFGKTKKGKIKCNIS